MHCPANSYQCVRAAACAAVLAWAGPALAQGGIYTCVDAKNRRLNSDRPIAECNDREQRELNPSGTVKRRIAPALTEREQALLEEQQRREAEEKSRVNEERRRDRALLQRYKTQAAHDAERASAVRTLDDQLDDARARVADLQQQRSALLQDATRNGRDVQQAPVVLRNQLAEADRALATQLRYVAQREQDKRVLHERFDSELARLKTLW